MKPRKLGLALFTLSFLLAQPTLADRSINGDSRTQAYIGVLDFDDQTGELPSDTGGPVEIDFANLLHLGIDAETPMNTPDVGVEWGINAGASFGWQGGDTQYSGSIGGDGSNIAFRINNDMLLVEGHIGPYFRAHMGEKIDLYFSAGPAIIYVEADADTEDNDEGDDDPIVFSGGDSILGDASDSDVILGLHARAGLEFDIGANRQWGIGIKYLAGELDFNNTVGEFDLEGFSVLLTYSAWY